MEVTYIKISIYGILKRTYHSLFDCIVCVTKLDKCTLGTRNSTIPCSSRFCVLGLMKDYKILMGCRIILQYLQSSISRTIIHNNYFISFLFKANIINAIQTTDNRLFPIENRDYKR